jgi:hypothetical protein
MRLVHTSLIIALSLVSICVHADSTDIAAAQAFFENYAALSDAYDDKVADLYSDSAVIRGFRRYPHGLERSMELTGSQWKALLVKAMPLARAQADRSTFSDVEVSVTGTKAKIKANRYAVRKCYTDTGYYMVVERQPDGKYLIVEEYSETQPQSNCQ